MRADAISYEKDPARPEAFAGSFFVPFPARFGITWDALGRGSFMQAFYQAI